MWVAFKKYETISDIFVAKKRLKNGLRYGFVRFKFVRDAEDMLKRLNNIVVGTEAMKIFHAYRRRNGGGRSDNGGEIRFHHRFTKRTGQQVQENCAFKGSKDNISYRDVVEKSSGDRAE